MCSSPRRWTAGRAGSPDVELTAEQAANFTYGEEMIANLKLPD